MTAAATVPAVPGANGEYPDPNPDAKKTAIRSAVDGREAPVTAGSRYGAGARPS